MAAKTHNFPLISHSPAPFVEIQQYLSSRVADISPFVDQLMRFLKRFICNFQNANGVDVEIEVALHEALKNAVVHGNREDRNKYVYVTCRCSMDGQVSIVVRDEGKGFDSTVVSDPQNALLNKRWGVRLMQGLMDEVRFEEGGRVVRMVKKLPTGGRANRSV